MASNQYVSNVPKSALAAVCPDAPEFMSDTDMMTMYKNGVASDSLTPDAATGRIPVAQLQAHIHSLEGSGILKRRPTVKVGDLYETDMEKLVPQDVELYQTLNSEYCFYEQRYRYALKTFLKKATSRDSNDNTAARTMLNNTKLLNIRVNSVLEVMNYLAQSRTSPTNMNKDMINKYNKSINDRLHKSKAIYDLLQRDNALVLTQREMVRYTEEKNAYTTNQIAVWAALNIVALGTIFYVYRN
jgi:hypothetical protein